MYFGCIHCRTQRGILMLWRRTRTINSPCLLFVVPTLDLLPLLYCFNRWYFMMSQFCSIVSLFHAGFESLLVLRSCVVLVLHRKNMGCLFIESVCFGVLLLRWGVNGCLWTNIITQIFLQLREFGWCRQMNGWIRCDDVDSLPCLWSKLSQPQGVHLLGLCLPRVSITVVNVA